MRDPQVQALGGGGRRVGDLNHLGPMRSSPILLEYDPLEVLEVQVNGPLELVLQDYQICGPVNALWEAAGPSNSLACQTAPDLQLVTPKFGGWLHHFGVQLFPRESPDKSPLEGLVSVEGGLVAEDDGVPEGSRLLGVFLRPLKSRMALRRGQTRLPLHLVSMEASSIESSSHGLN